MEGKNNIFNHSILFKKLLNYRQGLFILSCILWILRSIFALIDGLVLKIFFDMLSGKPTWDISVSGLIFLLMFGAFGSVLIVHLGFKVNILLEKTSSELIRRNVLNSILKKPGAKALKTTMGEAINSLSDDVNQIETCVSWLPWLVGQLAFALLALIIMLKINLSITLIVTIPSIVIVKLVQKSGKIINKNREKSRIATSNVTGNIGEIFESVLTIKVSGTEKAFINTLKGLNDKRHKLGLKDELLAQLIDSVQLNISNIGKGLIFLLAGGAIASGTFTIGDFALFITYLFYVADGTESLGNFLVYFHKTGTAFKRLANLIDDSDGKELVKHVPLYITENHYNKHNESSCSMQLKGNEQLSEKKDKIKLEKLELKSLTYKYDNSYNGISNIDLTINKGEIIVIAGRTGSGKTTLLKTLLGLLPAISGEICWNDTIVEDARTYMKPPRISYTSQVPKLFSSTIRENILLDIPEKKFDLDSAIYSAVLENDLDVFDDGLDTVIGPSGVKLSGGQRQRVAAARMFARKGELLVFDDISSALDINTEKILWTRLLEGEKPTCIIVSNRRYALELADKIIVMKDGLIENCGSLNDLLNTSEELRKIWG